MSDEIMENRQKHIHIEKIKLIYLHSLIPAVLSAVASFFVVAALWSTANHSQLLIWFSLTILLAIYRVCLILNFKRTQPAGEEILAWELPYAVSLIIIFLIWGVGLLWIIPKDNLTSIFIFNTFCCRACWRCNFLVQLNTLFAIYDYFHRIIAHDFSFTDPRSPRNILG